MKSNELISNAQTDIMISVLNGVQLFDRFSIIDCFAPELGQLLSLTIDDGKFSCKVFLVFPIASALS